VKKTWKAIRDRRRFENDLAGELSFHIEARADDLQRSGHSREEALRLARLEIGAVEHYKEECRQARGLRWLDELRGDLLYALRGLKRNRVFAAVAILTLTLGIGANTTIFALVNSVMFKTLPVERPEELHAVYWTQERDRPQFPTNSSGASTREGSLRVSDMFAYPHFTQLRSQLPRGVDLFAFSERDRLTVEVDGHAVLAQAVGTSWNYFRALGVPAYLGRTFLPEDEARTALTPAAVLNHDFWMRSFGGDRGILGKAVRVGEGRSWWWAYSRPAFTGSTRATPSTSSSLSRHGTSCTGGRAWTTPAPGGSKCWPASSPRSLSLLSAARSKAGCWR
jgi:hypothetical protein